MLDTDAMLSGLSYIQEPADAASDNFTSSHVTSSPCRLQGQACTAPVRVVGLGRSRGTFEESMLERGPRPCPKLPTESRQTASEKTSRFIVPGLGKARLLCTTMGVLLLSAVQSARSAVNMLC